ncbi:membrane protein insertase YidC [Vicingus serpentipes]|uniref:Membrane protein insertase YidC n=1 Tax=Vicingus serpentipes TaxID=1926625 RepID=A0A5C6RU84_9FLAO|nr:membrane protein insertase YidC [Vicingus serpentipes]TXB65783.1 membrane protein insertase YidC [Vicingus serpentipes]
MSKKGLDKNSIIGLVLISAILLIFSYITSPTEEELKAKELAKKKQTEQVEKENTTENAVVPAEQSEEILSVDNQFVEKDSLHEIALLTQYGPFTNSLKGESKNFTFENEKIKVTIANKGGRVSSVELKDFHTYDSLPLMLFNEDSSRFNIELTIPGITGGNSIRQINTEDLYFETAETEFNISGTDEKSISFKLYGNSKNQYIEYLYTLKGNSYVVDFNVNTVGFDKILSPHSNLFLNWSMFTPSQEKTIANQKNISTIYFQYNNSDMDYINPMKYEEQNLDATVDWIMFKQQYFNTTLIATETPFLKTDAKIKTIEIEEGQSENYVQGMGTDLTIPFNGGSQESFAMQFYFGPNKYEILEDVGYGIENSIDFGWPVIKQVNKYIIRNVFLFFNSFGLQIGLVILLLTFTIKLLLFPITWKTYLSSAKMRVLKPEIDALKEKITDKMKLQQATMSLYRQTGVNPLAGCIPMLIQMPILFALFRFFPATFDMRQKSFLWAEDLSTYDSIYELPFSIPMYGDHVSLFTLLMAISMIFYTKANSQMTAGAMEGPMAGQMKMMTYLMPIMMLFFFNSYAAGLSFYYLIANIITILQQWVIRKWIVDEDKILAKLQSNKVKPKKKSGFAAKLEAKMKEAQQLQERKKKK